MKYATFIVSALIVIAVIIPGRDLPDVNIGGYDKLIHVGMFAVWAIAVRYDFRSRASRYIAIFICGMLFSLFTEILQLFVEGRSFDPYDMMADGLGLIVGLALSGIVIGWLNRLN